MSKGNAIYEVKTPGRRVEVYENVIVLSAVGMRAFVLGIRGEKTIPISSIRAVQFKPCGWFNRGFLQFTITGGDERSGGTYKAVSDENSVIFDTKHNKVMREIRDHIIARIV